MKKLVKTFSYCIKCLLFSRVDCLDVFRINAYIIVNSGLQDCEIYLTITWRGSTVSMR